jgi:hypothetical protein
MADYAKSDGLTCVNLDPRTFKDVIRTCANRAVSLVTGTTPEFSFERRWRNREVTTRKELKNVYLCKGEIQVSLEGQNGFPNRYVFGDGARQSRKRDYRRPETATPVHGGGHPSGREVS